MYEQILNLSKDEIDNIVQQCKHRIPGANFDNKRTLEISTSPGVLKSVIKLFDRLRNSYCLKDLKVLYCNVFGYIEVINNIVLFFFVYVYAGIRFI